MSATAEGDGVRRAVSAAFNHDHPFDLMATGRSGRAVYLNAAPSSSRAARPTWRPPPQDAAATCRSSCLAFLTFTALAHQ